MTDQGAASEAPMAELGQELTDLDKLVHEPARLAILTVLQEVAKADFTFLQRVLGVTQGNLSSHLTKLEASHLVRIEKTFLGRRPSTFVRITAEGRTALADHWARLDRLRRFGKGPSAG